MGAHDVGGGYEPTKCNSVLVKFCAGVQVGVVKISQIVLLPLGTGI